MNARNQQLHLRVASRQVDEAVCCVFHTLLLHRSLGKFVYKSEGNYSIGVVGTEDVDCESFDLTYVRVRSAELARLLRADVLRFRDALRSSGADGGRLSLEFYQKRKRQWPLPEDVVPWEIWHLQLELVRLSNESESTRVREATGDALAEAVLQICAAVNRPQYVPKMPVRSDVALVFDTRFRQVQPYLFRTSFAQSALGHGGPAASPTAAEGLTSTVKRLLQDTLSM